MPPPLCCFFLHRENFFPTAVSRRAGEREKRKDSDLVKLTRRIYVQMFKHHTRILAIFLVGFCSLSRLPPSLLLFTILPERKRAALKGKSSILCEQEGEKEKRKKKSEKRAAKVKWEREQKLPGICCCEWAKCALHMLGRKGLGSTLNFSLLQSCRRYARGTFPRCTWLVTCEISPKIDPICVVRCERWKTNKSWAAAAKKTKRKKSVQNSDNNEIIDGLRAHGKVILVITRKEGQRIAEDIELCGENLVSFSIIARLAAEGFWSLLRGKRKQNLLLR